MKELLRRMVGDDYRHGRWLNTLSLMENCGARKIMQSEPGLAVGADVLQHAAEEARHAHFFKKKIGLLRKAGESFADFSFPRIWGGARSKNYLSMVEGFIVRSLNAGGGLSLRELRTKAYWATTYVIELRAMQLYPLYEEILQELGSPVSVHSVIEEEKNHLQLMEREMGEKWGSVNVVIEKAVQVEQNLYLNWLDHMRKELDADNRTEIPFIREGRSRAQL